MNEYWLTVLLIIAEDVEQLELSVSIKSEYIPHYKLVIFSYICEYICI